MTLREQQSVFLRNVGLLIGHIYAMGYEGTGDWLYRPLDVAAYYASEGVGIRSSLHTKRLAIDINLFHNGVWLRDTRDHQLFGLYWEGLHPLCRWGGRWGDGNHYSMEWQGVK